MANYNAIRGRLVQKLSSDPTLTSAYEGQVWYNSTESRLKGLVKLEAWASAAPMVTPHRDGGFGSSSPTSAAWAAGGTGSTRNLTATEEYNGSGWSSGGSLNTGREEGTGFGLVNAAALAGGSTYPPLALKNEVEEYNGTSWTAATALPAKRKNAAGCGTQTAGLVAFGAIDPPSSGGSTTASSLEYDGTSWTAGGTGNKARRHIKSSAGSQTAGLAFGGEDSPPANLDNTEEYDGSTWTTSGVLNNARSLMGGNGIQTSALAYAGFTPYSSKSEKYDGTSWTNTPELATARDRVHGAGATSAAAVCSGGLNDTGVLSITEEFDSSINVITAGAWASGGNLPSANNGLAGAGSQTAALAFGSRTPGQTTESYEYDGSSWTAGGDINYAAGNSAGLGTQTAAVSIGGGSGGASNTASSSYDGSSWTANNVLNGTRSLAGGAGTSTAGLAFGGFSPSAVINTSEHWDGTNWTTSGNMNTARMGVTGAGTQSNAVAFGGINYPASVYYANTEDYNGSTWTNGASMSAVRNMYNGGDGAAASAAWAIAGDASSNPLGSDTNFVELYNETVWVTQPSLATGRRSGSSAKQGTSSSTIFFGGRDGSSDQTATEEFTGQTSTATGSIITTS